MKTDLSIESEPALKPNRQLDDNRVAKLRRAIQDPDSIEAIRANNLHYLCRQFGGPAAVAEKLGYANPSRVYHIAGSKPVKPMGEKTARQIEKVFDLPHQWMDIKRPQLDVVIRGVIPEPQSSPIEGSSPAPLDVALTMSIVHQCIKLLEEHSLQLSIAKFADLLSLALAASAKNNGKFDAAYMQQILRLMK